MNHTKFNKYIYQNHKLKSNQNDQIHFFFYKYWSFLSFMPQQELQKHDYVTEPNKSQIHVTKSVTWNLSTN